MGEKQKSNPMYEGSSNTKNPLFENTRGMKPREKEEEEAKPEAKEQEEGQQEGDSTSKA